MRGQFTELDGHDAYELLGIAPGASPKEIKRAHIALVRKHHPDRFQDERAKAEGAERTRLINAARDVLLNHRASYDAARRPPEPEPEPEPDEELIEDPWDTAASTAPPDPWATAAAGAPQPGPWDTAAAGAPHPGPWTPTAPGPPPPPRVRHIHHYHPTTPRRGAYKAGIGCAVFVFVCWALIVGTVVITSLRPDGPEAETSVHDDLAGTWTGTVQDRYGRRAKWAVELKLKKGERVGEVRYLKGRCAGKAVPVSYAGKSLIIRTDFPDGQSSCDVGDITLTRRKDGKADIVYYASNQKTKRTTGVLRHPD